MSSLRRLSWIITLLSLSPVVVIAAEQSWPQFRGPTGQGHSAARDIPLRWSETENVVWKVPVGGSGWSSPVVDAGQIWLTTSYDDGKSLRAICLDAATGDLVHEIEVVADNRPLKIHKKNNHASPSAVIDGDHVFVHFGTYATACLDRQSGEVVWRTRLEYDPFHGPGGSPVVFENLLIVNCDGGDTQAVVALDKMTGQEVWRTPRAHISEPRRNGQEMPGLAFSTPLVTNDRGRDVILSPGADHIAAYDPRTGQEIWWSGYNGYSVVPRPIVSHGLTFAATSYDKAVFYAIRLGGQGDVTSSHATWSLERGAPKNPSPLAVGDEIYLISDNGIATCLDVISGQQHWQRRLGGDFSASPLLAERRIYLTDENGKTTVIAPGKQFQVLATNQVDGRTLASLAAIDGALFLRSDTHLYRISSSLPVADESQ